MRRRIETLWRCLVALEAQRADGTGEGGRLVPPAQQASLPQPSVGELVTGCRLRRREEAGGAERRRPWAGGRLPRSAPGEELLSRGACDSWLHCMKWGHDERIATHVYGAEP
jgi:hypothetical protein